MQIKRWICVLLMAAMLIAAIPVTASAGAKYTIQVDLTNQIVTVFNAGNVSTSGIVRQMICSSGKADTPTPTGTFTLPAKSRSSERSEWYYFSEFECYAKYATRIKGGYLFHSVIYNSKTSSPSKGSVNALGSPASHGCIRLRVEDAKWIAQNCPAGTKCKIFYSGNTNSALRSQLKKSSFSIEDQSYGAFVGTEPTLTVGDKGDYVKQMQTALIRMNLLNDKADGIFGSKTKAAVMAFQAKCGLKQTGIVTQALWNQILSGGIQTVDETTVIRDMQTALATLKCYSGEINGKADEATAEAIREYQRLNGLSVTGIADTSLRSQMLAMAKTVQAQYPDGRCKPVVETSTQQLGKVKVNTTLTLRERPTTSSKKLASMSNGTILTILSRSSQWSEVLYGSKSGFVSNAYVVFFDSTTQKLSYVLDESEPIEEVEPEEVEELTEETEPTEEVEPAEPTEDVEETEPIEPIEETKPEEAVPTPPPTACPETLTVGSEGIHVRYLQEALRDLKLFGGKADGVFGADTETALRQFQTATNLPADGKATTAVQNAILAKAEAIRAAYPDGGCRPVVNTSTTVTGRVSVKTTLNLRKQPSTTAKKLASLKNGTLLPVLAQSNGWSMVQYGNTVAFVSSAYLVFNSVSTNELIYERDETQIVVPEVPEEIIPEPVEEIVEAEQQPVEEQIVEEQQPVEEQVVEEQQPVEEQIVEEQQPVEEQVVEEQQPVEEQVVEEQVIEEQVVEEQVVEEIEQPVAEEPVEKPVENIVEEIVETVKEEAAPAAPMYAVALKDDTAVYTKREASKDFEAGRIPAGMFFEILERDEEWISFEFKDAVFYIRGIDFEITEVKPAAQPVA